MLSKRLGSLAICSLTASMLSACGGAQKDTAFAPTPSRSFALPLSTTYKVLLQFDGKNGSDPAALTTLKSGGEPLNVHSGPFYATTRLGGTSDGGTFYSLTPAGKERVLHNFNFKDEQYPDSALTGLSGRLYGTTNASPYCGETDKECGLIFSVSTSGHEQILHTFGEPGGGQVPSGLTVLNGTLYGTTSSGGTASGCKDCGTVFSLTTSGKLHVIYSFQGPFSSGKDGASPDSIVAVNGTLYGTTAAGGTDGDGTVFSITPAGKERVLYSFEGGSDGNIPISIVALNGTFYGTTAYGGSTACGYGLGCGTVFSITPDESYKLLYRFQGGSDGWQPRAGLTVLNGKLYGTTGFGGGACVSTYAPGCGTVFSVTTAGEEQVLHSFEGGSDGRAPEAALTPMKGTVYGTTSYAGAYSYYGTAFALTP